MLALLLATLAAAAAPCRAQDPLEARDPVLQLELEGRLRDEPRLWATALERRLAVAVVDLTRAASTHFAGINDDHMLYAASLPKIVLLLGAADAAERGALAWTTETRYRLHRMIVVSDNAEASWAAESVGLAALAALVQRPGLCLFAPPAGGLWVGRPYKKGGPTLPDPVRGLSHGATARQVARFYTMLERGHLLSPAWSAELTRLMAPPGHAHKLVAALGGRRGVRFLARKSGTWRSFHSDSALIDHYGRRYVLAVLADDDDGEALVRRVGELVDEVMMQGAHRRALGAGVMEVRR